MVSPLELLLLLLLHLAHIVDDPPVLTDIQLHVYQYYPFIAALSLNSSVSPPTNVHWSIDGYDIEEYNNCYNSYQILTDRSKKVIYNIVLDINGCYGSGQFNVSINTNDNTNTSKDIIISKEEYNIIIHLQLIKLYWYCYYSTSVFSNKFQIIKYLSNTTNSILDN